jgi:iron complex outermembrane recepter protein
MSVLKRHRALLRATTLTPAICLSFWAASASGQSISAAAADTSSNTLEEVVVTARRRSESLQDVPISISAFGNAQVEQLAITNQDALNKLDPALSMNIISGNRGLFNPFIRGQGPTPEGNSSVISYFAEVPNFPITFNDLQNIQVLKGPQGTLFGATATAGAILFNPIKPDGKTEGYFEAEAGNYGYEGFDGAIGTALIDDKLFVRIAAQIRKRDGYVSGHMSKTNSSSDFDNIDERNWRVSAVLRPIDNLEFYTIYQYSRNDSNGTDDILYGISNKVPYVATGVPAASPASAAAFQYYSGVAPTAGATWYQLLQGALAQQRAAGLRQAFTDGNLSSSTENQGVIETITAKLTDQITLKDIVGAYWGTVGPNGVNDSDGSALPLLTIGGPSCISGISPANCRQATKTVWSNEIQAQGNFLNSALTVQTGFFWQENPYGPFAPPQQPLIVFGGTSGVALPATACAAYNVTGTCQPLDRTLTKSYAPYLQATYKITDTLSATLGGREQYDSTVNQASVSQNYTVPFQGFPMVVGLFAAPQLPGAAIIRTATPLEKNFTYTASLDWKITPDTMVYATTRKGVETGGINNLLAITDPHYFYQPEIAKDVEAGIKSTMHFGDIEIRSNVDAYNIWYSNVQERTTTLENGAVVGYLGNVAAEKIYGAELSLDIVLSKWFDIGLYDNYNNAKYTNWTDTNTCSSLPFYTGCAGAPGSALVVIDHAHGVVTANGVRETVLPISPDIPIQAPKNRWAIRPAVHMGFMGERFVNATLSANIYSTSSYSTGAQNGTRGDPTSHWLVSGYTLADMRLDWKDIAKFGDNGRVSWYAQVTNVANLVHPISTVDVDYIVGASYATYTEPRMFWTGVRVSF